MAERVRIMHYEADDVRRILGEYHGRMLGIGASRGDHLVEDLVNAIGEVYETALARRDAYVNVRLDEVAK